jgi:hypothetical protein
LPCIFQGGARQTTHVCRAFCSRRTAKGVPRRLVPVPLVAFFCRASWKNARQRLSTVRCQTWRTAKRLYRAKCYRALFCHAPRQKTHGKASVSCSECQTNCILLACLQLHGAIETDRPPPSHFPCSRALHIFPSRFFYSWRSQQVGLIFLPAWRKQPRSLP